MASTEWSPKVRLYAAKASKLRRWYWLFTELCQARSVSSLYWRYVYSPTPVTGSGAPVISNTAKLVVDQAHRIHRRTADADRKALHGFAEVVLQFQRHIQITIEYGSVPPVGNLTQRVIRIAGRTAQRTVGVHQRILLRRSAHDGIENTRGVVVVPAGETAAVDPTAHVDLCREVLGDVDVQVASQVETVHAHLSGIVVQVGIIEHTAVVHVAGRHHVPHGFRTAADIDADVRDQSRLLDSWSK